MSIESQGIDESISELKKQLDFIQKLDKLSGTIIDNNAKSTKDKITERRDLADRLAQTPEEAMAVKRADDAKLGIPTEESPDLTDEQLETADDEMVERMVDDLLKNTLGE